ncbi:MAG: glycosyltransferase family 2 protein [Candidatus Hydrogenedentes bacterium]|nr:glycosyltransferase family 2 protein [Candidatus Hydrogenedentota bacterium]
MSARVSIVIPTWNRKELLRECLESIGTQTFREFDVIVVDDGSTDGTVEDVRKSFPHAQVVARPVNGGFCAAANAGIREASSEYILLLNNDMTLNARCLERLVAKADASDAAMFAPLVVWRAEPEIIYGTGDLQRTDGRPESRGFRRPIRECTYAEDVFGVSAGAALYRREVFDRVGVFDERFVAYFEDSDLNFRARLAGYRACFVADAIAKHVGSASLTGRTWWRTRQCCRNHALLVIKNMPAPLLIRYLPSILLERLRSIGRVISSARAEFGMARAIIVLAGLWWELVGLIPHALAERRRIQRGRTVSAAQLDTLLTRPDGHL